MTPRTANSHPRSSFTACQMSQAPPISAAAARTNRMTMRKTVTPSVWQVAFAGSASRDLAGTGHLLRDPRAAAVGDAAAAVDGRLERSVCRHGRTACPADDDDGIGA